MGDYFMRRLYKLVPVLITPVGDLPEPDPDQVVEFSREFIYSGTPAFRFIYYAMILFLQGLCLATRRKSVYRLSTPEADKFMQSLCNSRLTFLGAVHSILGMPIYMAHYNRDDIQARLGFDILAMREEAAGRRVER